MYGKDVRVLKKIQRGEYDYEVELFIYDAINWYKEHYNDLKKME